MRILQFIGSLPAHSEEKWGLTESKSFGFFASLVRSQGLASDKNGNFWFAANQTLLKTSSDFSEENTHNPEAIPAELRSYSINHIGDIDYYNGKIYAPMEDGNDYKNPFIGIFNAETLVFEKALPLARSQQNDGIPWITVDNDKARIISSVYRNAKKIYFYENNLYFYLPSI